MTDVLDALYATASHDLRHELDADLARRTVEARGGRGPSKPAQRVAGRVGDPSGRTEPTWLVATVHPDVPYRETGQRVTVIEVEEFDATRGRASRWIAMGAVTATLVLTDPRNPPTSYEHPRDATADGVASLMLADFRRDGFEPVDVGVVVDDQGRSHARATGREQDGVRGTRRSGAFTDAA